MYIAILSFTERQNNMVQNPSSVNQLVNTPLVGGPNTWRIWRGLNDAAAGFKKRSENLVFLGKTSQSKPVLPQEYKNQPQ